MVGPMGIWPWVTGAVFLTVGLAQAWRQCAAAQGIDKLVALGRAFVAASLAAFGAEHLAGAQFIMQGVPAYMPGRLFWAYFVGVALLATALSIVLDRYVRWSGMLAGAMVLLFVMMIHTPNLLAHPNDRIVCAVLLRDVAFAMGLWALAASRMQQMRGAQTLVLVAQISMGVVLVFFAVEHFLHPEFALVVPLQKMAPAWEPAPMLWGYLTGALLLVSGVALLMNWRARAAASWLGLWATVITAVVYLPMLLIARDTGAIVEGLNYTADTLLFAGVLLVLAGALAIGTARARSAEKPAPRLEAVPSSSRE